MARSNTTTDSGLATAAAARLRAKVENAERELEGGQSTGFVWRWLRRVSRFLTFAVVAVLLVIVWLAYDVFRSDGSADSVGAGPAWSNLEIWDDAGMFGGQVEVSNPTDRYVRMYVTVDLFDGDQDIADLSGSVTLKPNSDSVVGLDSFDEYVAFDDAHVDLLGLPG